MEPLRIHLFRAFQVQSPSEDVPPTLFRSRKVQELLSYLFLNRDRPHRREALMLLLWEDSDDARAQKYLRQTLWQLQADLDAACGEQQQRLLEVDSEWVHTNPAANVWCDAVVFQEAFRLCQGTKGTAISPNQAHLLEKTVPLYQGELLEGWDQTWCLVEREYLYIMFVTMLEKLMDHCEVHGRYEDGIAYGMQVLKKDRARETTYRRLMRLYSRLGDRTSALNEYTKCATALREELNVDTSHRTQQLHERIRNGELDGDIKPTVAASHDQQISLNGLHSLLLQLHSSIGDVKAQLEHEITTVKHLLGR